MTRHVHVHLHDGGPGSGPHKGSAEPPDRHKVCSNCGTEVSRHKRSCPSCKTGSGTIWRKPTEQETAARKSKQSRLDETFASLLRK